MVAQQVGGALPLPLLDGPEDLPVLLLQGPADGGPVGQGGHHLLDVADGGLTQGGHHRLDDDVARQRGEQDVELGVEGVELGGRQSGVIHVVEDLPRAGEGVGALRGVGRGGGVAGGLGLQEEAGLDEVADG